MSKHGRFRRVTTPTPAPAPVVDVPQSEYWGDTDDCGDDRDEACWQCRGQGVGLVGVDWDSDDPINGPYVGEVEDCPCCGGSGKAEDCWYW